MFVHEPFGPPRTSGLRVGVIADGTTRGGPNGLTEGATRVIECAEHCAKRDDVALLAVCILSPQNIARRKPAFFAALHAEFLRLVEGVASGRLLAGIRIEVHGRLDRLAQMDEAAQRLAHVIELLCETTAGLKDPRLRLVFCIDYDEDTPLSLALDLLIRTGMEEPSVLRLSGLRVQPNTLCIPHVKLWRNFSAADLEPALVLAATRAQPGFAPGFSSPFIVDFLSHLTRSHFSAPLRITLPVAASTEELAAVLECDVVAVLNPASHVAVTAIPGPRGRRRHIGPRGAPVRVRLMKPGLRMAKPLHDSVVWLVPGQSSPALYLLERSARDANIHLCDPTPAGIIEGLRRAVRFHEAYPPLHGAPRPLHPGEPADTPALSMVRESSGLDGSDSGLAGKRFAMRCILDARASGLFSGEVDWTRQAFGYAMTAYAIGAPPPDSVRTRGTDWEPATRTLARVMLALASSDEEITDRIFPGEDDATRRQRVAASSEYLIARVRGASRDQPDVSGKAIMHAIGSTWESFFAQVAATADETILGRVKQSAEALYRANLAELSQADPLFTSLVQRLSGKQVDLEEPLRATSAPEPVIVRILELLRQVRTRSGRKTDDCWRELRLLCRLSRVAPSIGAGCALLAMAATEPARAIPPGGASAFVHAMPLIDHYFRLVNDLAFEDAIYGDRDDKVSTFTCLIPAQRTGKARERACVAALQTCRTTAVWLEAQIWRTIADLARRWPLGARWLQRGVHVGRRVYARGHYARLAPESIDTIVVELDMLDAGPEKSPPPMDV